MPKFAIKTSILKKMVSTVIHGAGNNKFIPLTSLMEIRKTPTNYLQLTTTTASNQLTVSELLESPDESPFVAVVEAKAFHKLVSKMTSDDMEIELVDEKLLTVKGNGFYKIEIILTEEQKPVQFPSWVFGEELWEASLSTDTIAEIHTVNKSSLYTGSIETSYSSYYFGPEEVITTDTFSVCYNSTKTFETPLLLSEETLKLLSKIPTDVKAAYDGNSILFSSKNCLLFSYPVEGSYNVELIKEVIDNGHNQYFEVPKKEFLETLDRITLFVSDYEENSIYLELNDKRFIVVSSKSQTGVEPVQIISSSPNLEGITFALEANMIKNAVSVIDSDVIKIWIGPTESIKIIDKHITICIPTQNM